MKFVQLTADDFEALDEYCKNQNRVMLARKGIKKHQLFTAKELAHFLKEPNSFCIAAYTDDDRNMMGGACLQPYFDKKLPDYKLLILEAVWSGEEFQRRGVAFAVISELLKRFQVQRICDGIVSHVHAKNPASIHLHNKLGFSVLRLMGNSFGNYYSYCYLKDFKSLNILHITRLRIIYLVSLLKMSLVFVLRSIGCRKY